MDRHINRRTIAVLTAIVTLVIAVGLTVLVVVPHLRGVSRGSPAPQTARGAASHDGEIASLSSQGAGPATVQLAAQDVTPDSRLDITASGFVGGEHLLVTIEDAQGHPYDQETLLAGKDGRLRETALVPPPQLASGSYQLLVVGSMSHRAASTTFSMHDIPPTVTLETYYSKPGESVSFTGSGFLAGEPVKIFLGPSRLPLTRVQATDVGAISGAFTVPKLPAGEYKVTVLGDHSQTPISLGFSIKSFAPWVVLDRYSLTPGESVGFIGQDFAPGEQVFVYLNSVQAKPVMQLTADPSGKVTVQDTWTPSGVTGQNVLTLIGQASKATATATFLVQTTTPPAAQPTAAPPAP